MSLPSELRSEIVEVRRQLLVLMTEADAVDDALKLAMHSQVSLKNAIAISLDHLDKIDQRLATPAG